VSGRGLRGLLAAICSYLLCGTAQAVTCVGTGATTAYMHADTSDLLFVAWQPEGDYRFAMLGAEGYQRIDPREPDEVVFLLSGLGLAFNTLEVTRFVDAGQALAATDILPLYAAWHARMAANRGVPYQRMEELARTRRPAYRSTPVTYFLRWRLYANDPQDVRGVYYLSAVTASGQRVATLAAQVKEPEQLAQAHAQLDRFATSFRLMEADDPCPTPKEK